LEVISDKFFSWDNGEGTSTFGDVFALSRVSRGGSFPRGVVGRGVGPSFADLVVAIEEKTMLRRCNFSKPFARHLTRCCQRAMKFLSGCFHVTRVHCRKVFWITRNFKSI
jgi:hypothetical protein